MAPDAAPEANEAAPAIKVPAVAPAATPIAEATEVVVEIVSLHEAICLDIVCNHLALRSWLCCSQAARMFGVQSWQKGKPATKATSRQAKAMT